MPTILIASSASEYLASLENLLTSHGCVVQKARHGAEALALAWQVRPDLVVSDVVMPIMDGYYLLWLWKSDAELRDVPFVIYTSMEAGTSDHDFATRLGADAFLGEPLPESALWARLEEVLAAPHVARPSISDAKAFLEYYRKALPRQIGKDAPSIAETDQPIAERSQRSPAIDPETMESEPEFKQITEAMPQIVWVARSDGWCTHVNQRWLDYTGLTPAESLGHGWLAPFHPDEQPEADVRWAEASATGKPFEIEYRLRAADGSYRWMLGRALPLTNSDGAIVKWMGTCTDIHDLKEAQAAVADAQRRQRLILESVDEGIHGLDKEGKIVFENPAAMAMFGLETDEMVGRDAHSLIHHHTADGEIYPVSDCPIYQTLRDGQVRRISHEVFFRSDGSSFPVEYVASPVVEGDEVITGAVVSFRDVTEQRAARDQLEKNATLLRIAGRVARLGGWTIDLPDRSLHWSDESAAIHDLPPGYQPTLDEGIGYYLPEHHEQVRRTIEECATRGTPYEFELPKITATGRRIWVRSTGKAVRDSEGRIIRLLGAFQDITERKEAEEALREKDAITRIAGRMTRTGGWALDTDSGRVHWSDELTHILGYPDISEQQLQDSISLYHSPGREILSDAIGRCMSDGTPFDLEAQLRHGDGSTIWVHVTGEAARSPDGNVTRIHGALQDITHKKELERQFLRAQRLDSIGTLASGIAHDFNNLLAPIVMGVSFLKAVESREKVLAVVDNIERSADRGKQLVRQILSFARGIEGERIPVDLRQVIGETDAMIASIFPRSISVQQEVDEDLWLISGDSTQITQVLLNLCVNARDSMPDGGNLAMSATNTLLDPRIASQHGGGAGDAFVVIEVADDGCGIPPEIRDRIFEPFFTTKPFGTGTGLGLSTALGIVRSHGGFIDLDTSPGSGTTFRVYLPAQPDATRDDLLVKGPESVPRGNGQLILVVDDEASILNVMQHTLEVYGYRSLTAEDGARALAVYERKHDEIDLVITDMMMPGMDGAALIDELRRLNPDLPIIAASGKGSEVDAILTQKEISAYLRKPYSAERLLAVLADIFGG